MPPIILNRGFRLSNQLEENDEKINFIKCKFSRLDGIILIKTCKINKLLNYYFLGLQNFDKLINFELQILVVPKIICVKTIFFFIKRLIDWGTLKKIRDILNIKKATGGS